ncbi:Ig domain-containing protein [Pseudoalteromonas sp. T1lg48]|uniref:Ig domain-containing protein n=1 Tax=Pseudoalteromonas sp. T1lg48 TaxID=2077100 RepID=UPI000CF65250|nr:Ig domain-containing protein [Pseudoalteromonas sp. T1lg48]
MIRIGLLIWLLTLSTASTVVFANVFTNMVNHPSKEGVAYSFNEGHFYTLQADENGWQMLDHTYLGRYEADNQVALYSDGRGALAATVFDVYFLPFDDQGVSTGEFQHVLDVPSGIGNYSIKLLPDQDLVLILGDTAMVQYQIVGQQAVEVQRYTHEDFELPNHYSTHIHPDGTLLDFIGNVYPWDGSNYSAPFSVPKLAEFMIPDVLVLDQNDGLIVLKSYTSNVVRFNWPLSEDSSPQLIANNWDGSKFLGVGSHTDWVRVKPNAFSPWLFDPTDPLARINSNFTYPHWLKSYQVITGQRSYGNKEGFEDRPVQINNVLWLGPLKIEPVGETYQFDYFSTLHLSNNDLLVNRRDNQGSPAWGNDFQQISSEISLGLSRYTLNETGEIQSKTVLEGQSQGSWAQLIMAEPLSNKVFALVLNPNDTFVYAQIYKDEQLLSEYPVFQYGHFFGQPIHGADSRPVISPDKAHVYFEVNEEVYYCDIEELTTLNNCAQIYVEKLTFPRISAYKDGIVYWGTHRHKFISISHNNDELLVEDKWAGKFEDGCCVETVFYNPVTDRLFVDDMELLPDGSVEKLNVQARRPYFYNKTTKLAFGSGYSTSGSFGYDINTDSYYQVEFMNHLYPQVSEGSLRAYLGSDLLVFDNPYVKNGIEVIKAPFLVNVAVDFNEPDTIYSYEELTLPIYELFTSEPEFQETWMLAIGYSSEDNKNAVPKDNYIRFTIEKAYSLAHDGSFPFKLVTEQGSWRATFPLKTQLLNLNEAPVFQKVYDQRMTVGTEYEGALWDIVSDPDGDNLIFTTEGLPAGLVLDGSYISGVPTKAGDYLVTVTATDPLGLTAQVQFYIKVENADSDDLSSSGGSLGYLIVFMLMGARWLRQQKTPLKKG